MLHIIKHFPLHDSFLDNANFGDSLILKDEAILAIKKETIRPSRIQKSLEHLNLYVKKSDLLSRNISAKELVHGVSILDDFDEQHEAQLQNMAFLSCN